MLETRKSGVKKINANFSFEFSQKCSKANDNALNNLEKVNSKVDFVITHCCDTHTVIKAFGFRIFSVYSSPNLRF